MKKFATILVLLFVLSISAFAEGDIHTGGLACPIDQTYSVKGEIPIGGVIEDSVFKNIYDFLKSIF